MNMQNVKDLSITEGDVRTIHDSNGNLLWGRLAYDTKYAGDTVQDGTPSPDTPVPVQVVTGTQTVYIHGKNLVNIQNMVKGRVDNGVVGYANNTTDMTISGNNVTFTTNAAYRGVASDLIPVKPNTNYVQSYGFVSGMAAYVAFYDSSENWISNGDARNIITPADCAYLRLSYQLTNAGTATISNLQLEQNSTATDFEAYQGATYTINLGSTELAVIGNYADKIYRSGSDWYVHKEIDSNYLTGNTSGMTVASQPGTGRFNIILPTTWSVYKKQENAILSYCNSYQMVVQTTYNTAFDPIAASMDYALNFNSGTGNALRVKNIDASTEQEMKDSMTATPLVLYYVLATSTNTKITDTTLIAQLNAIHEWLTRYGYNSTVSGNLPLLIEQTNIS